MSRLLRRLTMRARQGAAVPTTRDELLAWHAQRAASEAERRNPRPEVLCSRALPATWPRNSR